VTPDATLLPVTKGILSGDRNAAASVACRTKKKRLAFRLNLFQTKRETLLTVAPLLAHAASLTRLALEALCALCAGRALSTRGTLCAGRALSTRGTLCSCRALSTRGTLCSCRALCAGCALCSRGALHTVRSNRGDHDRVTRRSAATVGAE
jgi:hypothetical protein